MVFENVGITDKVFSHITGKMVQSVADWHAKCVYTCKVVDHCAYCVYVCILLCMYVYCCVCVYMFRLS